MRSSANTYAAVHDNTSATQSNSRQAVHSLGEPSPSYNFLETFTLKTLLKNGSFSFALLASWSPVKFIAALLRMACKLFLVMSLCGIASLPAHAFMIHTCSSKAHASLVVKRYSHSAEAAAFDRVLSRTRAEDLPVALQQSLGAASYLDDAETRKRQRREAVDQSLTLFNYTCGARRPRSAAEVLPGAVVQSERHEPEPLPAYHRHRKLVVDAELIEARSVKHAIEEVIKVVQPLLKARVKVAIPDSGRFLKRTS
jgi:hypothetical protein